MPRQRAYTKTQYDVEKGKESGTFQVKRSKLKRHRALLKIKKKEKEFQLSTCGLPLLHRIRRGSTFRRKATLSYEYAA